MSLRPLKTTQKVLFSTTSRLNGEYEKKDILITHAWPNLRDKNIKARWEEGPASRNAYVFVFSTPENPDNLVIPNFAHCCDLICIYLSILFGKRFDSHGQLEGSGFFNIPDYSQFNHLCECRLPQNSHKVRADYPVPLNLTEISRIEPLFFDNAIDNKFLKTFQASGKFYWLSLKNFEHDPEAAYLNLITAGEILSNFFSPKSFDLGSDLIDSNSARIIKKMLVIEPTEHEHILSMFNKIVKIKKSFVDTITRYVDDDFFNNSESITPSHKFNINSFRKTISAAYDLRCEYIHTGASFGDWISLRAGSENYETQGGGIPKMDEKSLAKIIKNAPTYIGLERVIRYCLLGFAAEHGAYLCTSS